MVAVRVNKDNKAEEALDSTLPSISACIVKCENISQCINMYMY